MGLGSKRSRGSDYKDIVHMPSSRIHTRYEKEEQIYKSRKTPGLKNKLRGQLYKALAPVASDKFYRGGTYTSSSSTGCQYVVFALGGKMGASSASLVGDAFGMADLFSIWQMEVVNRLQQDARYVITNGLNAGNQTWTEKYDWTILKGQSFFNDFAASCDIFLEDMRLDLQVSPSNACFIDFIRFVPRKNNTVVYTDPYAVISDDPNEMGEPVEGGTAWYPGNTTYTWGDLFDNQNFTKTFKILDIKRTQSDGSSAIIEYSMNRKPNMRLSGMRDFHLGNTTTAFEPDKVGLTEYVAVRIQPCVNSAGVVQSSGVGFNCVRKYSVKAVPINGLSTAQKNTA